MPCWSAESSAGRFLRGLDGEVMSRSFAKRSKIGVWRDRGEGGGNASSSGGVKSMVILGGSAQSTALRAASTSDIWVTLTSVKEVTSGIGGLATTAMFGGFVGAH